MTTPVKPSVLFRHLIAAMLVSFCSAGAAVAQTGSVSDPLMSQQFVGRLDFSAVYANFDEWGKIRAALGRLPGASARIRAISVDGALISLDYNGTYEQLRVAFAQAGLRLSQDPRGVTLRFSS